MASLLVVEDNPLVVELLRQVLEGESYDVRVAANGKLGVEAATRDVPDLVLMDLTMPVMDGWAAIRALRAEPATAHLPIIALSARIDPSDIRRAIEAGADAHVGKPLDEATLLAEVRRLLSAPRATGVRETRTAMAAMLAAKRKS